MDTWKLSSSLAAKGRGMLPLRHIIVVKLLSGKFLGPFTPVASAEMTMLVNCKIVTLLGNKRVAD